MKATGVMCLRKLPRFTYLEAGTVAEACALLSEYGEKARVVAGGTDLLVSMKMRRCTPEYIINLKNIPGLDQIRVLARRWLAIGALATLHDIERSRVVRERLPVLAEAARLVAQPQIRNMATIGGNLCNAAPSADTAPALIALGASVRIASESGERVAILEEFFTGPGETVLQAGEIVTEVRVPPQPPGTRGTYLKLPARTAIDIALVGVAVVLTADSESGTVSDVRIVLGAVAPTPIRARVAEEVLNGRRITPQLIEKAARAAAAESKPITDVRGSASYRREMVAVLTGQALRRLTAAPLSG